MGIVDVLAGVNPVPGVQDGNWEQVTTQRANYADKCSKDQR